jgi:defect in organelle trafficking protein DotC
MNMRSLNTRSLVKEGSFMSRRSLVGLAAALACSLSFAQGMDSAVASGDKSVKRAFDYAPPGVSAASFADVQNAKASEVTPVKRLTPVREAALRDTAIRLGVQWGLGDRSREIYKLIEEMAPQLDRRYEFGALMIGVGFLPPVISEARDSVAIDGTTMRVAKSIYKIDEPPRPVRLAPTWRDWVYVGLDPDLRPSAPKEESLLPRDDSEKAFWKAELDSAYIEGRKQANEVFDLNLARLQKTYGGMRRYFDLYKRGIVTAPQIVSATSIVNKLDPNTVVIGDTVFSVTVTPTFNDKTSGWVPLAN